MSAPTQAGIGVAHGQIVFCLGKRPPLDDYPDLNHIRPLKPGEVHYIGQNTSNHWRKIFNVSAKFLFELRQQSNDTLYPSWQALRDDSLFQAHGDEVLLFTPTDLKQTDKIYIICGKTYAQSLELGPLLWLDNHFAISEQVPLIVSPYLDYRQLSNERITRLVELVINIKLRHF